MQRIWKCWPITLVLVLVILATGGSAAAISINLMPALLTGQPGTALTFSGILANTAISPVFLNGAGINLGGFAPANEDLSPFFANAPLSLAGGGSTSSIGLFTIGIPNPFSSGTYQGTFTVLGGADENALVNLGAANFTVQVIPGQVTPEPSAAVLLGVGWLALRAFQRRKPVHLTDYLRLL